MDGQVFCFMPMALDPIWKCTVATLGHALITFHKFPCNFMDIIIKFELESLIKQGLSMCLNQFG